MAFKKKTWFNRGNETKTPINETSLNDLEQRIANSFDSCLEVSTNENGSYAKFENGLLIQFGKYTVQPIQPVSRHIENVKLPLAYKNGDYILIPFKMTGGASGFSNVVDSASITPSTTNCEIVHWNNSSTNATIELHMAWMTIGFWK